MDLDCLPAGHKACEAAVRIGLSSMQMVDLVTGLLTEDQRKRWACEIAGLHCDPSAPPETDPGSPPPPNPGEPDWGLQPPSRPLWEILLLRAPGLSEVNAKTIADECERLEAGANAVGF